MSGDEQGLPGRVRAGRRARARVHVCLTAPALTALGRLMRVGVERHGMVPLAHSTMPLAHSMPQISHPTLRCRGRGIALQRPFRRRTGVGWGGLCQLHTSTVSEYSRSEHLIADAGYYCFSLGLHVRYFLGVHASHDATSRRRRCSTRARQEDEERNWHAERLTIGLCSRPLLGGRCGSRVRVLRSAPPLAPTACQGRAAQKAGRADGLSSPAQVHGQLLLPSGAGQHEQLAHASRQRGLRGRLDAGGAL